MRQDAVTLERFYGSVLGAAAARILSSKITDLWGASTGLSVLGLGYALPVLDNFAATSCRCIAAIPSDYGQAKWAAGTRGNATASVPHNRLPFPDGLFDRVIVLHGLEEAGDPRAYLREIWRVTAPEGRIVLAAANRSGLWSRATRTPFGQGRPWSRHQLLQLLSSGLFQVTASTSTIYMPPLDIGVVTAAADGWETIGQFIAPGLGGVVLVEAVKRLYASPGGGGVAPVTQMLPSKARIVPTNQREGIDES